MTDVKEPRIQIDEANSDFIKLLSTNEPGSEAPFKTMADAVAFAASYGASLGKPLPIATPAKSPDPIRMDIFVNNGYERLIDLLAAYHLGDVREALNDSDQSTATRIKVFEGYANAGLLRMKDTLSTTADRLQGLLLILRQQQPTIDDNESVDVTGL